MLQLDDSDICNPFIKAMQTKAIPNNKYPITMELQIDGEKVNGSLYYDKYGPDNILVLSGGLNKNEIELNEFEKNGKPTGHFRGKYSNGVFQGEYTTSKGKTMSFAVSE